MFEEKINEGIRYIASQQQANGSFLCYSSQDQLHFDFDITAQAIFPTTQVLLCLNYLHSNPALASIKEKCSTFLLSQRSKYWSFNYWVKDSRESKLMPYPDDLDDTFCALSGLYQYNRKLIGGNEMAKIVSLLTSLEHREGGPYYTWLVPPDGKKIWKDVDIAVNSNIAYFLYLQEVELPNVNRFIEAHIDKADFTSPYYPTLYPVVYFISRFYQGNRKDKLVSLLLSRKDDKGTWENPLNTALAISSLINLGIPSEKFDKGIDYILQSQNKGCWPAHVFYLDPTRNRKTYYAGTSALTTAFCLEALGKYAKAKTKIASLNLKPSIEEKIYKSVLETVEQRFVNFDTACKNEAFSQLRLVLKGSSGKQIPLLPHYFRVSLGKYGKDIPDEFIIKLGSLNVFGWIAYTIYDNFLDEEADPKTLSIANIALRELTICFYDLLPKQSNFWELFQEIMDGIDEVNLWEVMHTKISMFPNAVDLTKLQVPTYKNFERLAQKSLGHGLGPVAILFYLGYQRNAPEVSNLILFFKHYLIARQLNDDAHDWENDLKRGYINSVAAILLKNFTDKNEMISGSQSKHGKKTDMKDLVPKLQKVFWYKTIVEVCQIIEDHILLAKKSLHKIPIINDITLFEKLLLPLEQATKKAIVEQDEVLKFLEVYK